MHRAASNGWHLGALAAGSLSSGSRHCRSQSWQDPHSISNELDDKTSRAIISRLESRGKDARFRSLFETYFPYVIDNCSNVLEIGAGTGVICRALAARGFSGTLVGIDQSPVFISAAQKFAVAEGLETNVDFKVADARYLGSNMKGSDGFDGVLMHTLISHVEDPALILRAARQVCQPAGTLVIVDGDYPSLSYYHADEMELSQTISEALVKATFASPKVIRDLPRLLSETGWKLESASGICVAEVGTDFSYWKTFAEAYMPRVVGSGLMAEDEVKKWWAGQLDAAEHGQFFASCTYFTVIAKAVGP